MRLFNKKAQSTAEYAIIIGVVIGVLVVTQIYVKRGIQAKMKLATDSYVNSVDDDATSWNYISPNTTDTNLTTQWEFDQYQSLRTRETIGGAGGTNTTDFMSKGGVAGRSSTEKTKEAKDDYQVYNYTWK